LRSGRGRFFSPGLSVSTPRLVIAIVEADATDRRMLCTLLSSLSVDVRVFDSAESYLEFCNSRLGRLDCLIADAELPGMSGIELLRLLRSRGVNDPVILLGAAEDVPAAVTAMRAGAMDFIEKSNASLGVLRRVSNLIGTAAH
jgi:two-component system response regulator DctR/two-component system response regulator FixJ